MQSFLRKICRRQLWRMLFLISLTLTLLLSQLSYPIQCVGQVYAAGAQLNNPEQLVQQGVEYYRRGDIKNSIEPWKTALAIYKSIDDRDNSAIVLENLARAYQQLGQQEQAIKFWQEVIAFYRQVENPEKVGQLLTELAQSHNRLGQYRRAITYLCNPLTESTAIELIQCEPSSALKIAQRQGDHRGEIAALGTLGNTYLLQGKYDQSIQWLEQGLELIKRADHLSYQANLLFSIGNSYANRAQLNHRRTQFKILPGPAFTTLENKVDDDRAKALDYFEKSFQTSHKQDNSIDMFQALLHIIPIYVYFHDDSKAELAKRAALYLLEQLPNSQKTVFATIDLANLLQSAHEATFPIVGSQCASTDSDLQTLALLERAVKMAQLIEDPRGKSFAFGVMGHFYECRQDYRQALELTQKARWTAADLSSQDSLYLWEWQTGRILKHLGQEMGGAVNYNEQAMQYYEQAITSLERIRNDLLIANRDLQFNFRDTIEPIYRELATLRLERESVAAAPNPESTKNFKQILNTIDSLKLAELQNYFGDDCVPPTLAPNFVEDIDQNTAVINTIILPDRTAVILKLPNGQYQLHWIELEAQRVIDAMNDYRLGLERVYRFNLKSSQKLYDWLIRPFEQELVNNQIKTLVFVQDGIFRSAPMSALHNGQQYLIQQYAIATTPSLQLTAPKPLNKKSLKAMILGLTQSSKIGDQYFDALEYVDQEIQQISALIPGSQQLRNEEFTHDRMLQEMIDRTYPIVHIATHAEFGPEPEDTFLVLGNNQKLAINDFDRLVRSVAGPRDVIELLTLTACQTAAGDERAALGLAGVAIQAGAKSVLASLWSINDEATAQISARFYQELLNSDLSKAEALRAAQIELITKGGKFAYPTYWAPFILIGNWL